MLGEQLIRNDLLEVTSAIRVMINLSSSLPKTVLLTFQGSCWRKREACKDGGGVACVWRRQQSRSADTESISPDITQGKGMSYRTRLGLLLCLCSPELVLRSQLFYLSAALGCS